MIVNIYLQILVKIMNENIAYFIGVLHSDATLYVFNDKKRNRIQHRFGLEVEEKSLPMVARIQQILKQEFNRNVKIHFKGISEYGTKIFYLQTSINNLLPTFSRIGINKKSIPKWISSDFKMFCVYLAGVIDGDGDVCIKRPKYPQCRIRITSGKILESLKSLVVKHIGCSLWIEKVFIESFIGVPPRRISGWGFRHCFYVSSKNIEIIRKFVYPNIQIKHKRQLLERFFKIKNVAC